MDNEAPVTPTSNAHELNKDTPVTVRAEPGDASSGRDQTLAGGVVHGNKVVGDENDVHQIDTGGGTNVQGDVKTDSFVGRDKHVGGDEVKGHKFEVHIGQLIQHAQQGFDTAGTEGPAPGESPYKGLLFFDVADARIFYGREQLTAQLVTALRHQRFLAIVGASGSGKSSLVRAGLVASLQRGSVSGIEVTMPTGCQQWPSYLITNMSVPAKVTKAS